MVLDTIYVLVLVGLVRRVWEGLAALHMLTAVDLRLAVVHPGPCTALIVVTCTEPAATSSTYQRERATRERACRHPWARVLTEVLDTAVLVTAENGSKDRLMGAGTTACLSSSADLGMAVVLLVVASSDADTATPSTDTEVGREASVCTGELMGLLDKRVLVATEEEAWVGLLVVVVPRDRRTDRPTDRSTKGLLAHRPV